MVETSTCIRERPARIDRLGYVAGVAILLLLTFMLYQRYHFEHDRTKERVPWGYGYNMLAGLEKDASSKTPMSLSGWGVQGRPVEFIQRSLGGGRTQDIPACSI